MTLNGKKTPPTILVVDDHQPLLNLVKQILENADFTVLAASDANKALRIEAEFAGTIDLMLSDVLMPGMSGPELARKMRERRPQTHILLMSAYPDGALLVLNEGWSFIQKPFLPRALVSRIKDVLQSKTHQKRSLSTQK